MPPQQAALLITSNWKFVTKIPENTQLGERKMVDRCAYCGELIEGHAVRTAGDALVHALCLDDIQSVSTAYQYVRDHPDTVWEILSEHKSDDELTGFWDIVADEYGRDIERWATK
jgi:hypothetical protein